MESFEYFEVSLSGFDGITPLDVPLDDLVFSHFQTDFRYPT